MRSIKTYCLVIGLAVLFVISGFSLLAVATNSETPLDFNMTTIDGEEVDLKKYKGKVMLMVNVASKCGLTPQYEALQALYEKYNSQGFVVLGFPANSFGAQEPGTNAEIKQFCAQNYGISFPLFGKISVKGDDQHPLYSFLTAKETNPQFGGEIEWNFTKFLIDHTGKIVARFEPRIKPDSPEVTATIEKALSHIQ